MRPLILVAAALAAACAASPPHAAAPPSPDQISDAGSSPLASDAPPGALDAETAAPPSCARAGENLVRLGCRPEAFPPPGADSFAAVCERMRHATALDPACLARARSLAEVRACGPAVRCAKSP